MITLVITFDDRSEIGFERDMHLWLRLENGNSNFIAVEHRPSHRYYSNTLVSLFARGPG